VGEKRGWYSVDEEGLVKRDFSNWIGECRETDVVPFDDDGESVECCQNNSSEDFYT
jgi:hypothetical protein